MSDFRAIHPSLVQRLVWLIAVPTGAAFVPWVVVLATREGSVNAVVGWSAVVVPLLGGLASLAYSLGAPLPVRRWTLLPYLLAAAAFPLVTLWAANLETSDGFEGVPIFLIGFFQPFLALAVGLVSYAWVPRR